MIDATTGLNAAMATISTLAAVMMIGLGFIARPSWSTTLWSAGFVIAMLSVYTLSAASQLGEQTVRRMALGVMLATVLLVWSGLRAWRGARSYWWFALAYALIAALALVWPVDTGVFDMVFRLVFLIAAVFAGLAARELTLIPERGDRVLLPLMVASLLFLSIGVVAAVSLVLPIPSTEALGTIRTVNSLGMLVYLFCCVFTLVSLVQRSLPDSRSRQMHESERFLDVANGRLQLAKSRGERQWAMIDFRLEELPQLRVAAGEVAVNAILDRFLDDVRQAFPTEASVGVIRPGQVIVLVNRPESVIRAAVRDALARISTFRDGQPVLVQLAASVGWALAEDSEYDVHSLLSAADAAAQRAIAGGGDRWVRV